jgi:hypothetical protein
LRRARTLARDVETIGAEDFHHPAALAACESFLRRIAFEREGVTPSGPDESGAPGITIPRDTSRDAGMLEAQSAKADFVLS